MNIQWSKRPYYTWSCFLNSSIEGDEGGIFSKTPDWKSLFLLKIKIKLSLGCPNKEHNAIFKHINQNIRAYPRSKKKSELIKDSENIFAYWKESEQSKALENKFVLFQVQLRGLGGSTIPVNKIVI